MKKSEIIIIVVIIMAVLLASTYSTSFALFVFVVGSIVCALVFSNYSGRKSIELKEANDLQKTEEFKIVNESNPSAGFNEAMYQIAIANQPKCLSGDCTNGFGSHISPRAKYVGNFQAGEPHGYGKAFWPEGLIIT